jgi:hypothetical protein
MPAATKAKPRIEAPTSVPRPLRGWWEIPAAARLSAAEARGLLLLGLALIVNAILLAPEIRIERVPVNDLSFHIADARHRKPFGQRNLERVFQDRLAQG